MNDYTLRLIFSFVSNEKDRDAVYRVSRLFRRSYRYVAPTNAYFFAMANNSIALGRRIFDSAFVIPTKTTLRLAFARDQPDHARQLLERTTQPISIIFESDLIGTAIWVQSSALLQVCSDHNFHLRDDDDAAYCYNPVDKFEPAFYAENVEFLRFAHEIGVLVWNIDYCEMVAKSKSLRLLQCLIECTTDHEAIGQVICYALSNRTLHTDPFVQYALDRFVREQDQKLLFKRLVEHCLEEHDEANESFDAGVFWYLLEERAYRSHSSIADISEFGISNILVHLKHHNSATSSVDSLAYEWCKCNAATNKTATNSLFVDICFFGSLELVQRCLPFVVPLDRLTCCNIVDQILDRYCDEFDSLPTTPHCRIRFDLLNLLMRECDFASVIKYGDWEELLQTAVQHNATEIIQLLLYKRSSFAENNWTSLDMYEGTETNWRFGDDDDGSFSDDYSGGSTVPSADDYSVGDSGDDGSDSSSMCSASTTHSSNL